MQAEHSDQAELIRLVYPELKYMARRLLRGERRNHTLQPTALVHEAFLRLFGKRPAEITLTPSFLALAARQMRRILIDHGRKRGAGKRNGEVSQIPRLESADLASLDLETLLAIDVALEKLGAIDQRALAVVELKFFAGFTNAETAKILELSTATVESAWEFARLWLFRELGTAYRITGAAGS